MRSSLLRRAAPWVMLLGIVPACASKKGQPSELAPLSASSWRVELETTGFEPALVAVPLGATSARPIVIVLHGAEDRAEWQCGSFRGVFGGGVFIVCPRGKPHPERAGRYTLGGIDETERELKAALKALKDRFGAHVAPSPVLLVGYAEGAVVAAELARQEPGFFARVALVAGNPNGVTPSATSIFAKGSGKRMLFFCTDVLCLRRAEPRALWLSRAGASSKVVMREVGPWLDASFTAALAEEMPWLLEGDRRWPTVKR